MDRIVRSNLRTEKIHLVIIYNSVVGEMYINIYDNDCEKSRRLEVEDYFEWINERRIKRRD